MTVFLLRPSSRFLHRSSVVKGSVTRGPLAFDGWYPRDHQPGPYPRTDEQRRAAAIKYGMRVEDYRPIDEEELTRSVGDYPELGVITYDHKDPYESWTDRHHRRNWGELVQIDMVKYRGDRMTFTNLDDEEYTPKRAASIIFGMTFAILAAMWYFQRPHPNVFRWRNPVMPKQYQYDYYRAWPFNDPRQYPIVNYTFDLVD